MRADSIQITSIADIAVFFAVAVAVGVGDLTRSGQGPANLWTSGVSVFIPGTSDGVWGAPWLHLVHPGGAKV